MRPEGKAAALFEAFSSLNMRAFENTRLLSCPNLSKAPNYGRVLERWLAGEDIRPVGRGAALRLCLRYVAANAGHFLYMLLGLAFIKILRWKRPPELFNGKVLVVDTFALLPLVADQKTYQERYLPGLAQAAAGLGWQPVNLYRLYGPRSPLLLWRSLAVLAAQSRKKDGLPPQNPGLTEMHLLTWTDWLRLLLHIAAYPFALLRLMRFLGKGPAAGKKGLAAKRGATETRVPVGEISANERGPAGRGIPAANGRGPAGEPGPASGQNPASGHDVTGEAGPAGGHPPEAYIRDALARTFGQCVLIGEARRLAGRRLGLLLAVNSRAGICSWFENQTIDKCFQHGLKAARSASGRRIPATGAQLFTWPPSLLNNHADDREIAFGLTPDKVLVNGPHFLPVRTRQKYALGPSLRYAALFEEEPQNPGLNDPLLVILSYHPDETRLVLNLVRPLAEAGQALVFRFHPATRPEDFKDLLPPVFEQAHGSLHKALRGKGAVLGAGSGSLAEAVCLGLPVLSARRSEADLEYLPNFGQGKLWAEARSTDDIQTGLDQLRAFRASPDYEATRLAFRSLLFTEPSKNRIIESFDLDQ